MSELKLTPTQQVKVAHTCKTAIGMRLDVRQDNGYITGVVDKIEPAYWSGGRLAFKVEMLCGSAKKRNTFYLSTFKSAR